MGMFKKGSWFFKLLTLAYFAAVAYLCFANFHSLPQVSRTIWGIPTDKFVHFCMFVPFPFLVFLAIDEYTTKPWHSLIMVCLIFIAGCAMAAGTEIVQSHLIYRSGDPKDFRADCIAVGISSLIVFIIDVLKQNPDEE